MTSLYNYSHSQSCEVNTAPFDVFLTKGEADTVVQPDVCVICNATKLTEQGCTGAPDLLVEVLSPGISRMLVWLWSRIYHLEKLIVHRPQIFAQIAK